MSAPDTIGWILRGPHIKRLLLPVGETTALVEIEPLAFHGLTRQRHSERWRISKKAARR